MARLKEYKKSLSCISSINVKRETTIVWDKNTGKPLCNAIVWQSRQSQDICEKWIEEGYTELIKSKTGLIINPYFSASKIKYMIDNNKLVRDKIPEIILKDNELPSTRILNDEEYIQELNKKLQEEVNEYLEAENIEEMVDILEVIRAILDYKGVTYEEIEEKRIKKATKRGAFKEKIYLEKVLQNGD